MKSTRIAAMLPLIDAELDKTTSYVAGEREELLLGQRVLEWCLTGDDRVLRFHPRLQRLAKRAVRSLRAAAAAASRRKAV